MSDMDFEDEGSDAFTVFTVTLSVRERLTEFVYLFLYGRSLSRSKKNLERRMVR